MLVDIRKIKVTERIRKEVGKIEELAANIREHGLIMPIAVMPLGGGEYQLLAGLRRLRAMELNGETEIDAKVFPASDAEAALKIEYSENDQREPFTYSENMDYARLAEEIETAKAKERMLAGKSPERTDPVDHGPQGGNKSRDAIGAKINMSGRQYDRAKYIAKNAPQEIIDELDRGERKIRSTYDELRAKEKAAAQPQEENIAAETAPAAVIPAATEPKSDTKKEAELQPAAKPEPQSQKPPPHPFRGKTDPALEKLRAQEAEAARKRQEFDNLSPDEKIAELQSRLKEERIRANDAESRLEREKELRRNDVYHRDGTIEMLNGRVASLEAALDAANARIRELEEKHERQ